MNETQLPCDPVDTKEDIPLGKLARGLELPRYREKELPVRACRSCVSTFLVSFEGLPGVLGNKGTLAKYRREQGNISQFLGTGEQNSKNYNTKTF